MKVLYAIIQSYIASAEPIGSRTLSKSFDIGVSSATIRNEMSDLEDMGYLSKTHTSSGRVPSDKAYRLYVDELLKFNLSPLDIDSKKNDQIKEILAKESWDMDDFIQSTAKILSAITNYTSVVATPKLKGSRIKQLQLLSIEALGILVIIVLSNGLIKNSIYKTDLEINQDELNIISNYLNQIFKGKEMDEILILLDQDLFMEVYRYKELFKGLTSIIKSSVEELISIDLYSEGIMNILNFPEYKDIEKAKSFVSFVEDKDLVLNILQNTSKTQDIDIIIGQENIFSPIKDISIMTATYTIGGRTIGKVGLIGPTRMDYSNLINTLKVFSSHVSNILDLND
ncbi:MAG: heat-inducible transcriptional repressor HrcA [Tissierellaceae bacterium]|nr:heat-inducible transcriptional repressor HrcA [Tissierellaceae bacterium]